MSLFDFLKPKDTFQKEIRQLEGISGFSLKLVGIKRTVTLGQIKALLQILRRYKVAFILEDYLYPMPEKPGVYMFYSLEKNESETTWSMSLGREEWSDGMYTINEQNVALQIFDLVSKEQISSIIIDEFKGFSYYDKHPVEYRRNMNALIYGLHANTPHIYPVYLIFGFFSADSNKPYTIYKLTLSKLGIDKRATWHTEKETQEGYVFRGTELSEDEFKIARVLLYAFPVEFRQTHWPGFASTGHATKDAVLFEFVAKDFHQTILINRRIIDTDYLPSAIKLFVKKVESIIASLNMYTERVKLLEESSAEPKLVNPARIEAKLARLWELDTMHSVPYSEDDKYILNKKAKIIEVLDFEQKYGIQLPQDYVDFILYLGDGGAGPMCGMIRLEKTNRHKNDLKTPFAGVDYLRNKYATEYWDSDRKKLLERHEDALKPLFEEDLEKVSTFELFKKAQAANLDFSRMHFYFLDRDYDGKFYDVVDSMENLHELYIKVDKTKEYHGYITVFAGDCTGLVVSGEDYGKIVYFGNDGDIYKTDKSFIEFYESWLDENLAAFEKVVQVLRNGNLDALFEENFIKESWDMQEMVFSILGIDVPKFNGNPEEFKTFLMPFVEKWKLRNHLSF